jgi:hypothetical protein
MRLDLLEAEAFGLGGSHVRPRWTVARGALHFDAMRRVLTGLLLASAIVCVLGACEDESYSSWGGRWRSVPCRSYSSCDTCTPVLGCGWCTAPNGSGVCSPDPDDCPTQEFSWTWNPSGCRVAADASVVEPDGAIEIADAGTPTADVATPEDVESEGSADSGGADATSGCPGGGDAAEADAPSCD